MADRPETFAFEAGLRRLDQQAGVLAELRSRASTLIAAAALTTALLGSVALKDEHLAGQRIVADRALEGWEWVAVGGFIALGLVALAIIWPWGWKFSLDPHKLLAGYVDPPNRQRVDEIERNLAIYLGDYFNDNSTKLKRLFWTFRLGCICLLLQVVAWILDLT